MTTPTAAGLAAEVRAEMARQGIFAATVASATGISPASLSRRLSGTQEFTVAEIFRVCDFLRVPLSEMLRRVEAVAAVAS